MMPDSSTLPHFKSGFSFCCGIVVGIILNMSLFSPGRDIGYGGPTPSAAGTVLSGFQDLNILLNGSDVQNVYNDSEKHNDNTDVARDLYNKVRIMCLVVTCKQNHRSKADHVMATWGKRCNQILFVSDTEDTFLPVFKTDVGEGREHLTGKTMSVFQYSYQHHINDADWFLKADDDTYVIVENLRYMLSVHDSTEPIYFGHHFKAYIPQGYFSGGAGYVISKEALLRFGKRTSLQCFDDHGSEDVEISRCMQNLEVVPGDSRDALGRTRFHCFEPEVFVHGNYPDWFFTNDKYGANKGVDSLSDYAISFHYVSGNRMYELEYYVYHLKAYGITIGDQDLNRIPIADNSKSISSLLSSSVNTTTLESALNDV